MERHECLDEDKRVILHVTLFIGRIIVRVLVKAQYKRSRSFNIASLLEMTFDQKKNVRQTKAFVIFVAQPVRLRY